MKTDARISSYLNHLAYIDEKPPPKQVQYMNYTHSVAWSFSKGEKCNFFSYYFLLIISLTNIFKL